MNSIAVLGMGAMGSRIAATLVRSGRDVTVWSRDAAKAEPLGRLGASIAGSPRAAAAAAGAVIAMVTDDEAARAVWLDPEAGALAGMKPGSLAIEMSTVTPDWARELARAAAKRGVEALDAPVAGSRPQAEAGQLVIMIGGHEAAVARAEPVLAPLAARMVHVGPSGQGAMLKLAVNALFAAQLESVAELMGLLARNGLPPARTAELFGLFPIVAPPIAGAARLMADGASTPQFTIDLIEKDLGYALALAASSGAALPGAERARAVFRQAQERGWGERNISGLAPLFA